MKVDTTDNNLAFGARVKLNKVSKSLKEISNNIGTSPEMLVSSGSLGSMSSEAGALATANYSGLAEVLPINVSIPVSTGVTSTAGYKTYLGVAKNAAEKEAKAAMRKCEEIPEQADPDFIKVIYQNIKDRAKNLFTRKN